MFFVDAKKAFMALGIGISTHFILDFLLVGDTTSGMKLLFPFSWKEWQYNMIRTDDYRVTMIAVIAAVLIYIIYCYHDKRKNQKDQAV